MGWHLGNIENSSSGVQSVTGLNTDNTDPYNPISQISVDNTTITGTGTPANPLVANILSGKYGSFYDTTIQTALINTPTAMQYNQTDVLNTNGCSIQNDSFGNPTEIIANDRGTYDIQFSAQMYRTAGGTEEQLYIWLRKNGVDVPFSATQITFKDNSEFLVLAWNFFIDLTTIDNAQIMWLVTDANIRITTTPVPINVPSVPSVILTIAKQF